MSLFGALILAVLSSALTYLAVQSGSTTSAPIALSPEVRKYLDEKMGSAAGADLDPQKLAARVAQMEAKLVDMERVRTQYQEVAAKSALVEAAISEQRRKREDLLAAARTSELAQLRNEMATICAGVTIKKVKESAPGPTAPRPEQPGGQ